MFVCGCGGIGATLCYQNLTTMKSLKHFNFKLYIRTKQGQEFLIKSFGIDAENYDLAKNKFNKMDLPFHHFSTVSQSIN